jgi:hypothetical protein
VLGPHSVIVVSPGITTDALGNHKPDWSAASETVVDGCMVQPGGGSSQTDRRDSTETAWTAWCPPDTPVLATDRILWQGVTYSIAGPVESWFLGSALDHKVLRLVGVTG